MGKVFNGDPAVLARYIDVLGSPSVFDFALKDNLSSDAGSLDALAGVFAKNRAYRDASRLATFTSNHDVPRFVSEVQARGGNTAEAAQRLDLALSLMYAARAGRSASIRVPRSPGRARATPTTSRSVRETARTWTSRGWRPAPRRPSPAPGPATGTLAARRGRADLRLAAGAQ